jgi:hypothetical protein
LYIFQKEHTHAISQVEDFLNKTSEFFRNYIRRGLLNIAEETPWNSREIEAHPIDKPILPIPPSSTTKEAYRTVPVSSRSGNSIPQSYTLTRRFPGRRSHHTFIFPLVKSLDEFMESYKLKMAKLQQLYGIKSEKVGFSSLS